MDYIKVNVISHILSVFFYDPKDIFADESEELFKEYEEVIRDYGSEYLDVFKNIKNSFYQLDLEELRVDYAKLFVGPFKLLAYPYGSVYLEEEKLLNGITTKEVEKLYLRANLELSDVKNVTADHIAVELEFISYMAHKLSENSNDNESLEILSEFIEKYYRPFASQLSKDIIKNAETEFYKNIGKMLELFTESLSNLDLSKKY
ncbi:molecular chaperone TorD family protein [Deferribacter thermophilus]|uniref:TorD/DmsD family molecular chaperone n=1 Tax=Deferribacter thermophilus TaxID=53573 RepID=UPI003C1A1788